MKVPVVIQHGERKVAASLIVALGRERTELTPTQLHVLELEESELQVIGLRLQAWAMGDAPSSIPALIQAPRDRELVLQVDGASPVTVPAGERRAVDVASTASVIQLSIGPAAAGAGGRLEAAVKPRARSGAKSGAKSGRGLVKSRSRAGGKARKARR